MAFFKFRARGPQANEGRSPPAAVPAESVEAMRRRARHRLLGAAVLVLVGVVGFPLLFDTQPRPISVDIPIEVPDRNKVKPLTLPAAPAPTTSAAPANDAGSRVAAAPAAGGMITESSDGSEIVPSRPMPDAPPPVAAKPEPKPEAKSEPKPAPKPERKPEVKVEAKPEPKPERKPEVKPEAKAEAKPEPKPAKPVKPAAAADDGVRARALLDGRGADTAAAKPAAASDDAGRFVVQVGAFSDADKAREVRQKLEKAGLKTYTNVAKTADGERTRVRVGPFSSRADADKAAAKVKGLALAAAVLTL
ncbi:MAG: SPOR domain-containing protein [Variovorax sp.]